MTPQILDMARGALQLLISPPATPRHPLGGAADLGISEVQQPRWWQVEGEERGRGGTVADGTMVCSLF